MTAPGVRLTDDTWTNLTGLWVSMGKSKESQQELERLRRLESAARLYAQTVDSYQRELAQLRKLSGLPNFGRQKLFGRIVGYFPYENRFTLSIGSGQGVGVGMPVVSADGLLGIIQTVEKDTSQALMLCSPAVKFGGMVQRYPEVLGLMKGQTPTRLVLDVLDNGIVEVGDAVVTSGLSQRIPRGIPVGTVAEVVPDPSYGTKRVFVSPSAHMGSALEVTVLR